jgi:hypothetical protein
MTNNNPKDKQAAATSKVARAAGVRWNILPGESAEMYSRGLQSTVDELGAKTELQVYLAEKIFQCIWWMRRYETQKHSSIIDAMVRELTDHSTPKAQLNAIRTLIQAQLWNEPDVVKIIESKGHTSMSLLEAAISRQQERIQKLDQQIAQRVKTLTQLQQSYEALVSRPVMKERLKLQNELLKRDLQAIEVDAKIKKTGDAADDKPQTKSRK